MRLQAALALAALGALVAVPAAQAHAFLKETSPPNQSVLPTQPRSVKLVFNEPVDFSARAIELLDAHGRHIYTPPPRQGASGPEVVVQPLPPGLADGTYVVAFRVVSQDSHPVSGGFAFSIGAPSAEVEASAPSSSKAVDVLDAVSRGVAFGGLALSVGGAFLLLVLWPLGPESRRGRRLLWVGLGGLLGGTLLLLLLQGPYATGGSLTGIWSPSLLDFSTSTRFGRALVIRLVLGAALAVLVWLALRRRRAGAAILVPAGLCAAGLIATWTLTDHSSTGTQVWLGLPAASVHLAAMTLWLGGLTFLSVCVLGRGDVSLVPVLPRFSRLGLVSFAALGATGLYLTWRQVGSLAALPATEFGQLLIVKSSIVAAIVGLAWFSRRAVGRAIHGDAVRGLRRTVLGEAILGVAVLGVTAVLVNSVPARIAYVPPIDTTVPVTAPGNPLDGGKVEVSVKPARQGENVADVFLTGPDGLLFQAPEVTGTMQPPGSVAAPLKVAFAPAEPGHFVASPLAVPFTGRWVLRLDIRTSDIDETSVDVPLRIR